jgi:hypothetical protein
MGGSTRTLVIAGAVLIAASCGGNSPAVRSNGTDRFDFAAVTAAHGEFLAARKELADIEARRGDVDAESLRAARARFDATYERDQKVLAVFLTLAVNERPDAPQTREGLRLYAESAVADARVLIDRGGDPARAVAVLERAEKPFRALGLAPPPALVGGLEEARRRQGRHPATGRTARAGGSAGKD